MWVDIVLVHYYLGHALLCRIWLLSEFVCSLGVMVTGILVCDKFVEV